MKYKLRFVRDRFYMELSDEEEYDLDSAMLAPDVVFKPEFMTVHIYDHTTLRALYITLMEVMNELVDQENRTWAFH